MNSMSVREGQKRIRNIAKTLSNDEELLVVDRQFLINALQNIANGDDAETELGVKAKKGERKGKHAKDVKITMQYIHGWIATAIAPEAEEGLGLTLKDAVARLKKNGPQTFLLKQRSFATGTMLGKRKEEILRSKRIKMPI
jgi:hypothetical protein